jgi:CubicO group peptidase (beta-lactamase class C family)
MREDGAAFRPYISRSLSGILLVAMIAFSLVAPSSAQTSSPGSAPQGDVTALVDELFEKWNRTDSPGCALSVMKDGRMIYKHGYGMADLDHDVTITPSTVFHVASMSKQFTAASIVLLTQQGKLSLDDDVRKYIPELPDFGAPITIRHLIHHTSGLRDQWQLLGLAGWRYSLDLITDEDVMSVVTRQKELNFKPGDKHVYSNTGYTLLALIVKRVSGMSFPEFTTKNIFEPLGMKNTHFRDDHAEIVKNNAYGYEQEKDGARFRLSNTNFDTVGATSLHTTVEDLALWDENFYSPRVGGPDFVSQMLQRGKLNNGEQLDYAFGLVLGKYKGLPTVDHAGADAGYRSDMTRFPEQHFSSAVLCNSSDTYPVILVQKVADIYLAQEMKSAAPDTTAAAMPEPSAAIQPTVQQISDLAGLYWNREDDQFVKAYMKEGKLRVALGGDEDFILKPVSETHFHLADVSFGDQVNLTFEPAAQDKLRRLLERFGDEKPTVYESVETFAPSTTALAEYIGEYTSEEIDPVYRVILRDGKLTLTRLKHKPTALEPRMRDAFSSSLGTIRFTRDANHHISGIMLNDYGIRNFRFTRRRE